jgi:hypothetical protein
VFAAEFGKRPRQFCFESIYRDMDYAGCARLQGVLTRRCLNCSSEQTAVQAERDAGWRIALHAALAPRRTPEADLFLQAFWTYQRNS